jgi:CRP/FNR family transcriptional regulator, cyclic AMP receptor protein
MVPFDPDAFIARMVGSATRKYAIGAVIFNEDEDARSVFYLRSGMIKITVESDQKQRAMIGVLDEGQFFGEACLNNVRRRLSTATAMIPSLVVEIPQEAMASALENPVLAQSFIAYLIRRNGRIESDLRDKLFNGSEQRLARLLIQLAHFATDGAPHKISSEVTQEMLAEMIGASRQTVNTHLNKFRKLGLIIYDGSGIEVRSGLLSMILRERP